MLAITSMFSAWKNLDRHFAGAKTSIKRAMSRLHGSCCLETYSPYVEDIYVIYRLGGPYWKNILRPRQNIFPVRNDLNGK